MAGAALGPVRMVIRFRQMSMSKCLKISGKCLDMTFDILVIRSRQMSNIDICIPLISFWVNIQNVKKNINRIRIEYRCTRTVELSETAAHDLGHAFWPAFLACAYLV